MGNRFIAAPQDGNFEIGEKHLLRAIIKLAIQDWFYYNCHSITQLSEATAEQLKLHNYFFNRSDDDYGSFKYATDHISDNPEGLRCVIRKFLNSGASRLALVGGNKYGNPRL